MIPRARARRDDVACTISLFLLCLGPSYVLKENNDVINDDLEKNDLDIMVYVNGFD